MFGSRREIDESYDYGVAIRTAAIGLMSVWYKVKDR
jgi:hypothetical protein